MFILKHLLSLCSSFSKLSQKFAKELNKKDQIQKGHTGRAVKKTFVINTKAAAKSWENKEFFEKWPPFLADLVGSSSEAAVKIFQAYFWTKTLNQNLSIKQIVQAKLDTVKIEL